MSHSHDFTNEACKKDPKKPAKPDTAQPEKEVKPPVRPRPTPKAPDPCPGCGMG